MALIQEIFRQQTVLFQLQNQKDLTDVLKKKVDFEHNQDTTDQRPQQSTSAPTTKQTPLQKLLGTSATEPICFRWIRGKCLTSPCPYSRSHQFDTAANSAEIAEYKATVIG